MGTPSVDEARDFLARHPEVDSVDLLISDMNGVLRGKRIPRDNLEKAYASGIQLPGSVFALDITGNTVEETGLGLDIGDRDQVCRPVPGTLMVTPWQRKGRQAQLLMNMRDDQDGPFFADPRNVLARQVERLAERGLKAVVAL